MQPVRRAFDYVVVVLAPVKSWNSVKQLLPSLGAVQCLPQRLAVVSYSGMEKMDLDFSVYLPGTVICVPNTCSPTASEVLKQEAALDCLFYRLEM